jgi:hypothetical protein
MQQQIQLLTSQIAAAQSEIQQLKEKLKTQEANKHARSAAAPSAAPHPPPPLPSQPPMHPNEKLPTHPWHDYQKIETIKQSLHRNKPKRQALKEESAARFFQPPTQNQGFGYVYAPIKTTIPTGKIRNQLRKLGINNSRILDVQYPHTNIVAFLVHLDYVLELKTYLSKFNITPINDFNPYEGDYLCDPKFAQLSKQDRDKQAILIQQKRNERAVQHLRYPIQYAVAKYFNEFGDISTHFWEELNKKQDTPPRPNSIDMDILDP